MIFRFVQVLHTIDVLDQGLSVGLAQRFILVEV